VSRSILAAALLTVLPTAARADLEDYVKRPEPKFAWKVNKTIESADGVIYDLELVSQVWQNIPWQHQLQVYQPKGVAPSATMLLWNTGGKANPGNIAFAMDIARKARIPVAFLYGIPNQPLFDGKKEDALIAETFVRYLDTRDGNWPLLFPMVKSVVKAMDALQAFAMQEWKQPVKSFIISGASKRGWTTWLTGATDPRVKAIAPFVIDTLSMVDQMEYAKKSFGAYSEMVHDYTDRKLVPIPDTDDARKLWKMVDPYFYRDKLTMPKLLVNGNNDRYWTVDALNLYWDGLKGDKFVTYVPNAGHDLKEPDGSHTRSLNALSAFVRHQVTDRPLPKVTWKHEGKEGQACLSVESNVPPKGARLWVATAPTRDFRKAKWESKSLPIDKGPLCGLVDPPKQGFLALYGELDFEIDGITYTLSTQIRVVAAK
jgi:PhoPQ-activated pathogenicity-related protein